ncbi:cell division protein FtsK [Tumebacillus algifaecis]|uniref:Cell division protein FtsK n=1 Tax=Tumebacillus algifaecis TaxID=1214604 RepID=A0A223D6X4_9BACL|nr:DNA translocase FtsK [Tumebacillus algifaecis]ASS77203.1 cell division protein FtsK [Tumebacillus algifaecis]
MARAKGKGKGAKSAGKIEQTKQFLKFELIGLSLIALAMLGLAAQGWVGKTVDYLFILLGGNWDWLLESYLIYLAVYLMIKRQRLKMTARQWGLIVFFLVLLTWSHMNLYDTITRGHPNVAPDLFDATMDRINAQSDYNTEIPTKNGVAIEKPSAGGGLTGFLIFSITHYLFDTAGTLFVLVMAGIMAVILITKKSLVATLGNGRDKMAMRMAGIYDSLREWPSLLKEKREKSKQNKQNAKPKEAGEEVSPLWELDDDEFAAVTELEPVQKKVEQHSERQQAAPEQNSGDLSFTVRSFADQLIAEQQTEGQEKGADEAVDVPRFVQQTDSPQIKIQFPVKQGQVPLDPPIKGVSKLDEPVDLQLDFQPVQEDFYEVPPLSLLDAPKGGQKGMGIAGVKANARKLEQTFESFGVTVKVINAQIGPTVTQYEVQPAVGVKVSKIVNLSDDIALALAAKDIRIEAPIPGKSAIGIEVPNTEVAVVTLREVLEAQEFSGNESKMTIALGRDISGLPIVGTLSKMPHLLVAGATGSGKSVCVNGIITSILYRAKPSEVKFIMVDPKMVELNVYNGIPHLMAPVVTDPRRAAYALKKVVAEMEHRYELFSKTGCRNIDGYNALMNEKGAQPLPYIVVIVDELADLMMVAPGDVEDAICRLAQMARAAGIHMIIATQRPSVDVITGVIKANIPSRIAFAVSSQVDSRTILDSGGAEKLLGRGDMLYLPVGASKPVRVQGAFLSDAEVERVVTYAKTQGEANYTVDLTSPQGEDGKGAGDDDLDDLFYDAVTLIVDSQQASVSLLQRKLKVGYARAARLVDQMEDRGFVGPFEGSKPREVKITRDQWAMMQQAASE